MHHSAREQETARLQALLDYNILDTPQEESFDSLARLAAHVCEVPIVFISMLDAERQWHKARIGAEGSEVPREHTFCDHTIRQDELFEIPDSLSDERFIDNPFVTGEPHIRFYAGMPLRSPDGYNVGTLCVVDKSPRELNSAQKEALRTIAKQVVLQLELRKRNEKLSEALTKLVEERIHDTNVQLRAKEAEADYLLEALNKANATVEFDAAGKILQANSNFLKLVGYTPEEIADCHWEKLNCCSEALDQEQLWEQISQGDVDQERLQIQGKDGKTYWVKATFSTFCDMQGQYLRILEIAQDITREMQAEQKMKQAKELAEKATEARDSFLANMSHEIRTPMNAILGFTDLLSGTDIDEEQREYVQSVKIAGENLLSIINDILDLSKIESDMLTLENEPFAVRKVLQNVQRIMRVKADEKQLALKLYIDEDIPPFISGDAHRLSQVLINLVGNAIKFTESGNVSIYTDLHARTATQDTLVFRIRDTGIGIPFEKLKVIFDRFTQANEHTTRKYGGTGLGLNITRLLIEKQGGSIEVESEEGTGSEFTFYIPFERTQFTEESQLQKPSELRPARRLRLLMCEDNALNQRLAEIVIRQFGMELDLADNGLIGLEMMQQKSYDLVLMDLQMPEKDGYQTTSAIRNELRSDVPIMAITAHSLVGEKEKCLEYGMNDYISKPFNKDELYAKIVRLTTRGDDEFTPDTLVDLSYLREISGANETIERDMINLFISEMSDVQKKLLEAVASSDEETICKLSHKLISSFGIIGADAVLLHTLEASIRAKTPFTTVEKIVVKITRNISAILRVLEKSV